MGHGDRWRAFAGAGAVETWLPRITQDGTLLEGAERRFWVTGEHDEERTLAKPLGMFLREGQFGLCAIVLPVRSHGGDALATAYPFPLDGMVVSLTVDEVGEECGGLEACVYGGTDTGLALNFFATDYFLHADRYVEGAELRVRLAGLAYGLGPAIPQEIPLPGLEGIELPGLDAPLKVSTEGMAAILPIPDWNPFDYSFQGPVRRRSGDDPRVQVLDVTVARPDDEFDIRLYVTEHAAEGKTPEIGREVAGALCLMGWLVDHAWPGKDIGQAAN